ncbi:MAG: NfeD family protein [Nocardioides sp.]|nr:NfeD family protein [Nocardioides sp.]
MEWMSEHLWSVWLGIAIVLGVGEMFSLDLILAMLAAGALVGMLVAFTDAPFALQALAAAGTSLATLALVRPSLVTRLSTGPDLMLGHGKLIGTQGLCTQRITGLEVGRVRLGGEIWSAAPYDDTLSIEPGDLVEVLAIRGATAYVHPMPQLH